MHLPFYGLYGEANTGARTTQKYLKYCKNSGYHYDRPTNIEKPLFYYILFGIFTAIVDILGPDYKTAFKTSLVYIKAHNVLVD